MRDAVIHAPNRYPSPQSDQRKSNSDSDMQYAICNFIMLDGIIKIKIAWRSPKFVFRKICDRCVTHKLTYFILLECTVPNLPEFRILNIQLYSDWPIPYGHFQLRWFCIFFLQGGLLILDRFWAYLTEIRKVPYEFFLKN